MHKYLISKFQIMQKFGYSHLGDKHDKVAQLCDSTKQDGRKGCLK